MSRPMPSVVTHRHYSGPKVVDGARVRAFGRTVFIPARHLRRVADRLHDIADDLERQEADQ